MEVSQCSSLYTVLSCHDDEWLYVGVNAASIAVPVVVALLLIMFLLIMVIMGILYFKLKKVICKCMLDNSYDISLGISEAAAQVC